MLCSGLLELITDVRHDSTANVYHTTVPCLVVYLEGTVAQTRELACTRAVIPEVTNRGDL